MTDLPDRIFKRRRTKMRLEQAHHAIELYVAQARKGELPETSRAAEYELLCKMYELLGRKKATQKCKERSAYYRQQAEDIIDKISLPQRRKRKQIQRAQETQNTPYRRETPVEQPKIIRGDKPKNR